jgi:putative ABC transport system substrate-binding protein
LLKETLPGVSRVTVLWNPDNTPRSVVDEMQRAGPQLGVQVQIMGVRSPGELEGVFTAATRHRAGALFVVVEEAILLPHRARLLALAAKHQLPTTAQYKEFVEAGGLLSYGPHLPDLFRRAAIYVDKILKGAKPGDLPVEQPTKFELVVNMKTANALGLTIPQSVLLRADEVIQ